MPLTCWDILKRRLLSVLCCVHVPMKPGSALAGLVLNCMELSPSPPPPPAPLLLLLLLALVVDSRALSRSRSLCTTPPLTSNSVSSDCRQRRGGRGWTGEPERKVREGGGSKRQRVNALFFFSLLSYSFFLFLSFRFLSLSLLSSLERGGGEWRVLPASSRRSELS